MDSERRKKIVRLLEPEVAMPATLDRRVAKANVLALLEIADAIDGLASEVEKVGWGVNDKS